jgi:hypothetical protein
LRPQPRNIQELDPLRIHQRQKFLVQVGFWFF